MRNLTITLSLVVFALAGFYAGAKYELRKATPAAAVQGAAATATTGTGGRTGGGGNAGNGGTGGGATTTPGGGGFGRGISGQVVSISGSTLTVQDGQGNQVKVQLSPTTTVTKTVGASVTDLAGGQTVSVLGQRGADGAIAATGIVITPGTAR